MKRMIDDKDYNKVKTDLNSNISTTEGLVESVQTLEGKNYYTIAIESNSLVITLEEDEADEENI